jgi:signal transduction histidine kinase
VKKPKAKDPRINIKRLSWKEYLVVLITMLCLTGGQGLIFNEYVDLNHVPAEFILANTGYWALITFAFILVTAFMRRKVYVKPMQILGEAAKQVADGNFSIFVPPLKKDGKKDYLDVMFEDFNRMVQELGSIETMKNDFISNVSHEMKTPLSVIQSYAAILKKENLTSEQREEYAETIITASANLTALVTNILKLNRLENQEITPAAELFDLCRQLSDCALAFESAWEQKGIEFEADIEDHAQIRADESMLEIIWNNLLSNAIKFTPPGGKIKLTQTSDTSSVAVTVADSGCGMNESTIKRIFDKFYQGEPSHSGEGNGLGLALTLRVIELAGGSISVQSKPNEGSIFTVKLTVNE